MFRNILSQVESQTISAGGDLEYDVNQWFSAAGDFVPWAPFDDIWRQFGWGRRREEATGVEGFEAKCSAQDDT